jgi:hypothetical protein
VPARPTRGLPSLRGLSSGPPPEPVGVLLLPSKLEEYALATHARDLLDIPRVVALEPPRFRGQRVATSDLIVIRQARRLRFPGKPRVLILFHPRQYRLARGLAARHDAEIWYVTGGPWEPLAAPGEEADLRIFDQRAREVAAGIVVATQSQSPRVDNQTLRSRLVELEIISSKPFIPGARIRGR